MDEIDCAWEHVEAFTKGALQAALTRSEGPQLSSGYCNSCDAEIEDERLQAYPKAQLCCDCAEEEEERRRRMKRCGPSA